MKSTTQKRLAQCAAITRIAESAKRAQMRDALYLIRQRYGLIEARRLIQFAGGAERLHDVPTAGVDSLIRAANDVLHSEWGSVFHYIDAVSELNRLPKNPFRIDQPQGINLKPAMPPLGGIPKKPLPSPTGMNPEPKPHGHVESVPAKPFPEWPSYALTFAAGWLLCGIVAKL